MVETESLDSEVQYQHAPAPNAAKASQDASVRLSFDSLLRYSPPAPLIPAFFPDQRRYQRLVIPNVVAYLGGAHASRPHQVANISVGGFCMLTEEHWMHGEQMPITLQREEWDGEESSECISLQALVTRRAHGEIGFSIALTPEEFIAFSVDAASGCWISKTRMEEFLEKLKKPKTRRLFLVDFPHQRPLAYAERTERLLKIASLHYGLPAPELWPCPNQLSDCSGSECSESEIKRQGRRRGKRRKKGSNREVAENAGKATGISN